MGLSGVRGALRRRLVGGVPRGGGVLRLFLLLVVLEERLSELAPRRQTLRLSGDALLVQILGHQRIAILEFVAEFERGFDSSEDVQLRLEEHVVYVVLRNDFRIAG